MGPWRGQGRRCCFRLLASEMLQFKATDLVDFVYGLADSSERKGNSDRGLVDCQYSRNIKVTRSHVILKVICCR